MDNVIFPMQTINITQRANSSFSHKNLEAWDIAGISSGKEPAAAPCKVKVLAKLPYETTGFANTVFFGSCDNAGKPCAVRLGNKSEKILTFAMTHCDDISGIAVGRIYQSGENCYTEGTKGQATGNHIHIEVAEGWQYKKHKRNDGTWETDNIMTIDGVFSFLTGWNMSKNLNGYSFPAVGNRNGLFTAADAQRAFNYVAGKLSLSDADIKRFDLDKDGEGTLSDAIKLFKTI